MPLPPRPPAERFWPKVDRRDGCWLWTAGKSHDGYGRFWPGGGKSDPSVYAHRFAYELLIGPVPAGLQLDHLCRVRACVNPAHLEPVTNRENHLRTPKATKTHCVHGHSYADGNLLIDKGRRACRACKNLRRRQQKAMPNCRRCGVPAYSCGRGWRHIGNHKSAYVTCGQAPLLTDEDMCRPLLASEVS